ncbi:MAG: hypothetical protein ACLPSW_14915 [Roseiarcus sp.]
MGLIDQSIDLSVGGWIPTALNHKTRDRKTQKHERIFSVSFFVDPIGPRLNSRVTSRHLAENPTKRGFLRRDDTLMATLLTFRPLSQASFRGSKPQHAVLWGHHF